MFTHRKRAKDYLRNLTRTEYIAIVEEAFLTLRQKEILSMKLNDEQIASWKIGNALNLSVDTVNKEFCRIYDKIAKVI